MLIVALHENTPITIHLEGYSTKIDPSYFQENFEKMKKNSFLDLPLKVGL